MNEMSHEANQLVHAGREAFRPTDADRARVLAAVAGAATLSVGVAAAATAQRSWGLLGLGSAARVAALALPVAAAGAYFLQVAEEPPAKVLAPLPAAVASARSKPVAYAAEEPAAPLASEPSVSVSPERSAAVVGDAVKPGNQIRQEVALLSQAQTALSRGRPQEALDALAEHAARFPRGALIEERLATRARTLCALGRMREAEAELKRLEKLNRTSAYLARARESCGSR
jgi:tetratricopeptide (TPR) repeat protein